MQNCAKSTFLPLMIMAGCTVEMGGTTQAGDRSWPSSPGSYATCEPGDIETRTRYASPTVRFPARDARPTYSDYCEREEQTRQCRNGSWTRWSGSHEYSSCTLCPEGAESCAVPMHCTHLRREYELDLTRLNPDDGGMAEQAATRFRARVADYETGGLLDRGVCPLPPSVQSVKLWFGLYDQYVRDLNNLDPTAVQSVVDLADNRYLLRVRDLEASGLIAGGTSVPQVNALTLCSTAQNRARRQAYAGASGGGVVAAAEAFHGRMRDYDVAGILEAGSCELELVAPNRSASNCGKISKRYRQDLFELVPDGRNTVATHAYSLFLSRVRDFEANGLIDAGTCTDPLPLAPDGLCLRLQWDQYLFTDLRDAPDASPVAIPDRAARRFETRVRELTSDGFLEPNSCALPRYEFVEPSQWRLILK